MTVFIVDISGKIPLYVMSLVEAISRIGIQDISLICFSPNIGESKSCVPIVKLHYIQALNKYRGIKRKILQFIKTLSILYNYLVLGWYIWKRQPDILHIEWFPLLDYVEVEKNIIAIFRYLAPRMKVVYTIHNVYPHDMTDMNKLYYRHRFGHLIPYLDSYIVHTRNTKNEVVDQFAITDNKIFVIPHGIFKLDTINAHNRLNTDDQKVAFIMYGNMSYYKGTDLLVKALSILPEKYKERIKLTIAGRIEEDYYKKIQEIQTGVETKWMPYFLDDDTLCQEIVNSDVILLPYRAISQSGVLLLALSFGKVILTSDLASFKETLEGYDDNMFFEAGNPKSLVDLLVRYIDNEIDVDKSLSIVDELNKKYSWDNIAKHTYNLYNSFNMNI